MKRVAPLLGCALPLLILAGCASVPPGPTVMALPGSGKTFDQFRIDDADCRQYASLQTGGTDANQSATDSGVRSAVVGTAIGAVAGAAIGGHQGAGVGAGTGLLVGSAAGSGAAQRSASELQRAYDHAYIQCMYAKGEQVPAYGVVPRRQMPTPAYAMPPVPAGGDVPPVPPGYPPPPPPPGSAPSR